MRVRCLFQQSMSLCISSFLVRTYERCELGLSPIILDVEVPFRLGIVPVRFRTPMSLR